MTKAPSEEALADLQRELLESVLLDRPLSGAGRAPAFPDRAFLTNVPVPLLDENLAPGLSLEDLSALVRVVSRESLLAEAEQGDVPYLGFAPPEQLEDGLRLTLGASIATAEPERQVLGLSTVQATFRRIDDRWELAEAVSSAS